MKVLSSMLILSSLGGCTAQLQSGPPPRNPPPAHRVEPAPPPHRHDAPPPVAPPVAERWMELAEPQRNDDFRDFIKVGPEAGQFNRVRISVTRGTVWFEQVAIEYVDRDRGKNQITKIGRRMNAGETMLIDLEGGNRQLARLIIYMDPAQSRRDRGAYRIFAN